jgi:hypothetical protein
MTQPRVGNRNVNLDAHSKADRFCERAHLFSVSSPQQRRRDYRPSQPFTFLSCSALLRSPSLAVGPARAFANCSTNKRFETVVQRPLAINP